MHTQSPSRLSDGGFRAAGGMIYNQDSHVASTADREFSVRLSASTQGFGDLLSAEKMRSAQVAYQKAMIIEKNFETLGFSVGDLVVTNYSAAAGRCPCDNIPEGTKGKVVGVKDKTCLVKFSGLVGTHMLESNLLKMETSAVSSLPQSDSDTFSWSLHDFLGAQGMDKGGTSVIVEQLNSVGVMSLGDLAVASAQALTTAGIKLLQARRLVAEANAMLLSLGTPETDRAKSLPRALEEGAIKTRTIKGDKHPETLSSLANLALVMMNQVNSKKTLCLHHSRTDR